MALKKLPERVVFRSSTPSVADIFVAAFFDCVKRYHNDNGPDNRIVPVRAPEIFAIDNITLEKIPDENDELALVLKDQCDKLTSAWYDYYGYIYSDPLFAAYIAETITHPIDNFDVGLGMEMDGAGCCAVAIYIKTKLETREETSFLTSENRTSTAGLIAIAEVALENTFNLYKHHVGSPVFQEINMTRRCKTFFNRYCPACAIASFFPKSVCGDRKEVKGWHIAPGCVCLAICGVEYGRYEYVTLPDLPIDTSIANIRIVNSKLIVIRSGKVSILKLAADRVYAVLKTWCDNKVYKEDRYS